MATAKTNGRRAKSDWTCSCCRRKRLSTVYFVCPTCRNDVLKASESRNTANRSTAQDQA